MFYVPGPMIHMHHPQNPPNTLFADRETEAQGDGVTCLRFHSFEVLVLDMNPSLIQVVLTIILNLLPFCVNVFEESMANPYNTNIS